MVRVTGNFASEAPLAGIVASAISAAFEAGWADPKKLSQAATRAKILRSQAIESIADRLGTRVDEIEIVGEGELATYLCIAGFLQPDRHLAVGAIDRGKIRAFTRTHHNHTTVPVDSNGVLVADKIPAQSFLTLQVANGETGAIQDVNNLASKAEMIVLDATASAPGRSFSTTSIVSAPPSGVRAGCANNSSMTATLAAALVRSLKSTPPIPALESQSINTPSEQTFLASNCNRMIILSVELNSNTRDNRVVEDSIRVTPRCSVDSTRAAI